VKAAAVEASAVRLSSDRLETALEDGEFVVYRTRGRTGTVSPSLLVMMLRSDHPRPSDVRMLEHEHSLRSELDPAWALQPAALTTLNGRPALVLGDPGGELLIHRVGTPMDVGDVLRVGAGLAAALTQLHGRGLIHKDIKPANVMTDWGTGRVWLRGFGITSRVPRERPSPEPPEFIAGTLAYMAPEQTGWMNRSIDARSDLYALGVVLYELVTGSLPFTASDPMGWVHGHIAKQPVPPAERRPGLPEMVSTIVMKLLAKTAEDRYQTAGGVERDLRRCLEQWERDGRIDAFPLAEHDIPDRLVIPEKLYGRAGEIETLLGAFERVVTSGTPELVLVSGYSGIGKSSVVNELHKVLVPPRGLFAAAKFDQYKRDIPYATLAEAFQQLVHSLLGKSEAELSSWRDALREALGPNARLMVDLVPTLELLIGEQPPVSELSPQEAQHRFQAVLRRFLGVFARPERPLALFLDDLQWLDAATLDLLEDLLTRSTLKHLMLIGAYRDNEVSPAHPLMRTLETIRNAGAPVHEIRLGPLSSDDVGQLVADAVCCERARAGPLAELVHEKTAGNPFFVIQFLSGLADEGLLVFHHDAARWSWDLGRIRAKGYTANVVDLVVGKLTRLPFVTQEALQQFACLGNSASLTTLTLVRGTTEDEVHAELWEAVRLEVVERMDGAYRFAHDRVQEASYSLIPEPLRAAAHLRIGRLLAAHTPPEKRDDRIFEIVNQFNRGIALITSPDEREQLAEFELIAGKRAKSATAYASSLTYLAAGRALLPEDCWDRSGDLTFALEVQRAECEFLTGAYAEAEERLLLLSSRVRRLVDDATVTRLEVELFTTLGRNNRAVEACLAYLRRIGVQWSARPTEQEVREEHERLWRQIGSRSIEDLLDLPLMTDPESRATIDVLTAVLAAAILTDDDLLFLFVCRMANLSLEHGNSDGSCFAYVWLGTLIGARFGNYRVGFSFGKLGLDLVEQRGLRRFEARVYQLFGIVSPWMQPVRTGLSLIRRALEAANRLGDVAFAGNSRTALVSFLLATGEPLADVQREAEAGLDFARRIGYGLPLALIGVQLRLIKTLRGFTPEFGSFDDGEFDEGRFEQQLAEDPRFSRIAFLYWLRKLQARFFAGGYVSAIVAAANAYRLWPAAPAVLQQADYQFYAALVRARLCDGASASDGAQHQEALSAHYRHLQEWAEDCPANLEDRAALIGAEVARTEGRTLDAEELYEKAIRSARANGFVHNEAIANELAARFYAARGFETTSHAYLRNARYGYVRWGAAGKVRQLDRVHPHLKDEPPVSGPTSTIAAPVEQLDLDTVIKASQAVSSEIVIEKVIDRLLRIAIEHAGAARGVLILARRDDLSIAAEANTVDNTVIVRLREGPVAGSELPESVVHYAARTRESVILDDASAPGPFSGDAYIRERRGRSVFCLPLVKQGRLVALLYLENSLASHVFTPARTATLKVLASQAAISLENGRLYRELGEREREFRRVVDANTIAIFTWDIDGRVLDANDAFLQIIGYGREDLRSGRLRWTDLTPPEILKHELEELVPQYKATGRLDPLEKEYFHKDGHRVPVLIGVAPFDDEFSRGMAFVADLTDRKRAEAEIRALKDQLYKENLVLRDEVDRTSMFEEIVGASQALQPVLARVAKVAPSDTTVLILGETGTGKELVARAIHRRSPRGARPFVSVNCAAIPSELIASELFGHEKGAFTGATQRRLGRFELAHGGTIFLDEVGELPMETQVALLHVLQEREFERVGGSAAIRVDVRVIAATNRDLQAAIEAGTFRSDLFYRLNVFPITVPPLRERADDIPLLVEYFIDRYGRKVGKTIRRVNRRTLDRLQSYPWPGNVRELQNVIERSVIVCDTDEFAVDDSWLTAGPPAEARPALSSTLAGHEKTIIEDALRASGGRVFGPSGAAARLGIARSTLESKIRALGINKNNFRGRPAKP
jgi:PAS domain S-box-containing protein